jgi:hypothetical protein
MCATVCGCYAVKKFSWIGKFVDIHWDLFQPMAQRQKAVVDDQELKSRIIARYSYVDKDDDIREHRPVGPKSVSTRNSTRRLLLFHLCNVTSF